MNTQLYWEPKNFVFVTQMSCIYREEYINIKRDIVISFHRANSHDNVHTAIRSWFINHLAYIEHKSS